MGDLFGTSGVRGIVHKEITPELALSLGKALAKQLGGSGTVIIGRDSRTSSKMLEGSLVSGILSGGCDIKKLGLVPTPAVGFTVRILGAHAGVTITASHNPPEYNGFKFFDTEGMAYTSEEEAEIEEICLEGEFDRVPWDKVGRISMADVLQQYMNEISNAIRLDRRFKVAVDCANGSASVVTPFLLEELGCETVTINSRPDGNFPGHPPEPVEENLLDLCKLVKSTGADVGIAHDGDGNRIAAVDEKGRFVPEDRLLALMGAHEVRKSNGKIVTTVDASKVVDDLVSSSGGEILRTRVGDISVAREMRSSGSRFGGEPSGAWIFGDVNFCPDGPLAATKILEMMAQLGRPLSEAVDELPSYSVIRSKAGCPNERKSEIMSAAGEQAPSRFKGVANILTIDGVRMELEDESWVLIRPSGTEPYIRITAEAGEKERAKSLVETAREILSKISS